MFQVAFQPYMYHFSVLMTGLDQITLTDYLQICNDLNWLKKSAASRNLWYNFSSVGHCFWTGILIGIEEQVEYLKVPSTVFCRVMNKSSTSILFNATQVCCRCRRCQYIFRSTLTSDVWCRIRKTCRIQSHIINTAFFSLRQANFRDPDAHQAELFQSIHRARYWERPTIRTIHFSTRRNNEQHVIRVKPHFWTLHIHLAFETYDVAQSFISVSGNAVFEMVSAVQIEMESR